MKTSDKIAAAIIGFALAAFITVLVNIAPAQASYNNPYKGEPIQIGAFCLADPDDYTKPDKKWYGTLKNAVQYNDFKQFDALFADKDSGCKKSETSFEAVYLKSYQKHRFMTSGNKQLCVSYVHIQVTNLPGQPYGFTWRICPKATPASYTPLDVVDEEPKSSIMAGGTYPINSFCMAKKGDPNKPVPAYEDIKAAIQDPEHGRENYVKVMTDKKSGCMDLAMYGYPPMNMVSIDEIERFQDRKDRCVMTWKFLVPVASPDDNIVYAWAFCNKDKS